MPLLSCVVHNTNRYCSWLCVELLTSAGFQEAIQESCKDLQVEDWQLEWVLRYTIIVKSRGIIKAKGYLVHARKSTK